MRSKTIPDGIVNPFSDAFLPTWQLWKDFRKEEHSFSYKGTISEQMALKRLCEVSEGYEDKAVRIIEQSISRGWMDFYKLKQPSNNGTSKPKADNAKPKQTTDNIQDRVSAAFNDRYGKWEAPGSEPHLKAV
jgi:hypothetical protein